MYKINELASLFGLTTPALRYYETEGLLLPDYRDPENGYRYYGDDSVDKLSQIIQLRFLGFGIKQVKDYFGNTYSKEDKINELKRIIEICNNQIMNLESTLDNANTQDVTIKDIPSYHAICSEIIISDSKQVLKEYGLLLRKAIKNNLVIHFPISLILTIQNVDKSSPNLLISLEVNPDSGNTTRYFKSQKMATLIYTGKHDNISEGYRTIQKYLNDHNLTPCGDFCEKYFGPLNPVTDLCTVEIRVPIAP